MSAQAFVASLRSAGLDQESKHVMTALKLFVQAAKQQSSDISQHAHDLLITMKRAGRKAPGTRFKSVLELMQMLLHMDDFEAEADVRGDAGGTCLSDCKEHTEQYMHATRKGIMQMLPSTSQAQALEAVDYMLTTLETHADVRGACHTDTLISFVQNKVNESADGLRVCVRTAHGKKWSNRLGKIRERIMQGIFALPVCR